MEVNQILYQNSYLHEERWNVFSQSKQVNKRYSNKQEMLNQCWVRIGSLSTTLAQHYSNISSTSRVAGYILCSYVRIFFIFHSTGLQENGHH